MAEQTHVEEQLLGYRDNHLVTLDAWGDGRPDDDGKVMAARAATTDTGAFLPWHTCPTCHNEFSEKDMLKVNGRWYCTKYGCAQDELVEAAK